MQSTAVLFEPCSLGKLQLSSRIVMAPMTRDHAPGGVVGAINAEYYRRRAADGVGLLISEGVYIDPSAGDNEKVPHLWGESALAGWRGVIDAVHGAGGKFFPQLWHIGMARRHNHNGIPSIGPSGLGYDAAAKTWKPIAEPMSQARIDEAVASYGRAAAAAMACGADGIELHGAHGYLIDQFFWSATNHRTDRYGGDWAARTRFACEVIRECRRQTAPDFPICLRFSQWKGQDYAAYLFDTAGDLEQFIAPLVDAGVDILHTSLRRYWQPAFEGSPLTLAGWTKKLSGLPVITVGSVGLDADHRAGRSELAPGGAYVANPTSIDRLVELFNAGEFDLVALGRALLADPHWTGKAKRGAWGEIRPYSTEIRNILQ